MPELSRFAGIIVKMLYNDTVQHNKPHVHVFYGEYQASIGIDGELLAGSLPVKQLKIVVGMAGTSRRRSLCILRTALPMRERLQKKSASVL